MKNLIVLFFLILVVSLTYATPGDILRSQSLTGQPANGVRGLAMDWDTGLIWVAGPVAPNNITYATMDPVTMSAGTWTAVASDLGWVFDIGYGFDDMGTKYLLMNDADSPFTKLIDPANGSYYTSLPDYYTTDDYTDGCSVDWDNNDVYLSSYANPDVVYYDGSSHSIFASISGALNMGAAVGWEHLFILRTSAYYTIEVYQLDGTFVESIPLTGWPAGNYVLGLSCGRVDAVGDNETLFFADFITHQVHEIEVGNYTSVSLTRSTWGEIKAGFVSSPDGNGSPSMRSIR